MRSRRFLPLVRVVADRLDRAGRSNVSVCQSTFSTHGSTSRTNTCTHTHTTLSPFPDPPSNCPPPFPSPSLILRYDWGVNCIHGVQTTCAVDDAGVTHCPTSFPNPVSLGAAWNASMYHEMGAIIGTELRALWLDGETEASPWSGKPHAGLDCWSPNINLNRDPRCESRTPSLHLEHRAATSVVPILRCQQLCAHLHPISLFG
jgi:hypothetical protein